MRRGTLPSILTGTGFVRPNLTASCITRLAIPLCLQPTPAPRLHRIAGPRRSREDFHDLSGASAAAAIAARWTGLVPEVRLAVQAIVNTTRTSVKHPRP